ncbi:NIPSNAP family containing protein [Deinococcus irradiatisoli]|uniref:NIPSNAP family containing protein n=1 Tax=Deinococcus irradiatisoli TaxID=2202254 RepID=A0A2Z3JR74_9DEIO|nr:NIPSNAP family protein [Deinococcus irradiatisoli]AWN23878.1 NIPSNAP family containing protein [Deinococcus irradiatisoli]
MFYELRRYTAQPGRRGDLVKYMEDVIIPYQVAAGMVVVASFTDEEDPDGYVWMRRFDDEAQREQLYAAAYDTERWKNEIGPAVDQLMVRSKMVVTRIVPTPKSVLR